MVFAEAVQDGVSGHGRRLGNDVLAFLGCEMGEHQIAEREAGKKSEIVASAEFHGPAEKVCDGCGVSAPGMEGGFQGWDDEKEAVLGWKGGRQLKGCEAGFFKAQEACAEGKGGQGGAHEEGEGKRGDGGLNKDGGVEAEEAQGTGIPESGEIVGGFGGAGAKGTECEEGVQEGIKAARGSIGVIGMECVGEIGEAAEREETGRHQRFECQGDPFEETAVEFSGHATASGVFFFELFPRHPVMTGYFGEQNPCFAERRRIGAEAGGGQAVEVRDIELRGSFFGDACGKAMCFIHDEVERAVG